MNFSRRFFSVFFLSTLCLQSIAPVAAESILPPEASSVPSALRIIDEHQHPKKGELWSIRFQTQGISDLAIYPQDQATIDDMDFVELTCNNHPKAVTVLSIGDVIYAKNYSCDGISTLSHRINTAGNHTLKFSFAGETAFAYNTAGVDWTALPAGADTGIKFDTTAAWSVTYGGGKFVAVGLSGMASYSSDGITWTSLIAGADTGIKFDTADAYSVTYGGGKFIVVGDYGKASYSSDGISWTSLAAGADTGIKFGTTAAWSVTYGTDKFVVVGNSGKASYSADGITWTSLTAGANTGIKFGTTSAQSVTYGTDKFVVVGDLGYASYSADGITWDSLPAGITTGIKFGTITLAYFVTYGGGKFVAVGWDGMASYSADGITWTSLAAGVDTGIKFGTTPAQSVTYGGGKFIAVGWDGMASYSLDTAPPTAAITYSTPAPNKAGASVTITATFSEPMADSPVPKISISGSNTLAATNMIKTSTTIYTYNYTVGTGNGTATVAMSTGTDVATNIVTSTPTSGATFVVDNTTPTAPSTPDLITASDTGNTAADDLTKDRTPFFSISCETDATVTLFSDSISLGTGTCASSTVTITSSTLSSDGSYIVKARQQDVAGNYSNTGSSLSFTLDTTPPTLSTLSPADNKTNIAITASLTIKFTEAIGTTGTGTVTIYKASDHSIFEQINVANGAVTGSGTSILTIDPTGSFANSTDYYVLIDANAFPDYAGNFFTGITDTTTWNFTTVDVAATPPSTSHGERHTVPTVPSQPVTVSPLYGPANNVPPAPTGIVSPLRDRLAARIEKRITQFPRLRTTLLRMLQRLDRRLQMR